MADLILTTQVQGVEQATAALQSLGSGATKTAAQVGASAATEKGAFSGLEVSINNLTASMAKMGAQTQQSMMRNTAATATFREQLKAVTGTIAGGAAILSLFTRNHAELNRQLEVVSLGLTGATTVVNIFGKSIRAVISLIGGKIAIIGALIAAAIALISNWEAVAAFTKKIWDSIKGYLERIWNGIAKMASGFGQIIKGAFQVDVSELTPSWEAVKNFFINFFGSLASQCKGIAKVLKGALTLDKDSINDGLKDFQDAAEKMIEVFKPVGKAIAAAVDNEDTRAGWAKVKEGAAETGQVIVDIGKKIGGAIKSGIRALGDWIEGDKEIKEKLRGLKQDIVSEFQQSADKSAAVLDSIYKLSLDLAIHRSNEELKVLDESRRKGIITTEQYNQLELDLKSAQEKRLLALADERIKQEYGIKKVYRKLDLESSQEWFGQMSQLMTSSSKRLFRIGKQAAIAETIIQTYKAAQGAFAAFASIPYVGPALGIAAAAAAVVAGMARVQAIRSQEIGGGGGAVGTYSASPTTGLPTGFGSSSSGATLNQPNTNEGGQNAAGAGAVQVHIYGNVIGNEAFVRHTLIPILRDEIDNRSVTIIGKNSTQAQQLQQPQV